MPILAFEDAADGYYEVYVPDGAQPPAWTAALTPCAILPPAELSDEDKARIKKDLLTIAREKREIALRRLDGLYLKALRANDATAMTAIVNCQNSLEAMFQDPRIVAAIDGDVKAVAITVYGEIIMALAQASPASLLAFKAQDAI